MQNIENSDLYFFNNMYDDKIVFEEMINDKRMNFFQSLRHQTCVQGFKLVSGKIGDFTVNPVINQTLGIPKNSYTLHLDYSIVPYYTKKRFLDKYGYNKPVTMKDIFKDHHIFNHMLVCQVKDYFFFGLEVAEALNGCYLIIRMSRQTGLTESYMQTLIEKEIPWTLFFQNQVQIYHTFQNKYLIFTGIKDDKNYYLPLKNFVEISSMIEKPGTRNEWNLFCTCVSTNENLTMGTNATIVERDRVEYVQIPLEFANYCIANSNNCTCYLMNSYRRMSSFIQKTNGEIGFSSVIKYRKNPIPVSNIFIYEWDNVNKLKKKIIAFDGVLHHPNLYDFTLKLNDGDPVPEYLYVEWMEASETQCKFDNIMKDLIDCYGNDFYTKLMNDEFSASVQNYEPTMLTQYDFKEFLEFEKYPNIREFRLKCLIESLQENPSRYKNLIKRLYSTTKQSIRHIYKEEENPEVFSRSVMDTSGEIYDADYAFHFSEPMMYFKVHLSKEITPSAIVFVNGYRVNTEYVHTVGRDSYIYIKRSDLDTTKKNVIEVEVFCFDSKVSHKVEKEMRFFSTGISTIIEGKKCFDDRMCIGQFSFVDKKTNYHLKPEEITFRYSLDEATIRPMSGEPIEFYFKSDDREFFLTTNDEFFIDESSTVLNVRQETVMEDIPADSHKILEVEDLFLSLNSSFRVNDDIIITNNNNYRKCYVKDGMKKTSLTMLKFREKLDSSRFRIYYGGKLLDTDDYSLHLPIKYNDDVQVSIFNISAQHRKREIIVEYLPIDEELIFDGIPDASIYHDGLFWFDHLDFPLIPEMMRVYINGLRVAEDNIIDVGAMNVFCFPDYKVGDAIKIFIPAIDNFTYGLQTSQMILNDEMMSNDIFRNFMISNAKK